MKIYKIRGLMVVAIMGLLVSSCSDDFLEQESAENVTTEQIGKSSAGAQAILSGAYASLRTYGIGNNGGHIDFGQMATNALNEMQGHDIVQPVSHWWGFEYRFGGRVATASRTQLQWEQHYTIIKELNVVIESVDPTTTDESLLSLLGQAQALRGLMYFNLARLYSHSYQDPSALCVPLTVSTSTDPLPRATVQQTYDLIIADLESAVANLANFTRSTKQEIDLNIASGILGKVYMEVGRYADADAAFDDALAGYTYMSNADFLGGFAAITNASWMWGADIDGESSTVYASFFSHFCNTCPGYTGALGIYKHMDVGLFNSISATDIRRDQIVLPGDPAGWGLPDMTSVKFRDATFFEADYVFMRAADLLLLQAEAKARTSDEAGAKAILDDLVGTRDPSYTTSANSGAALLDEIHLHRRIELWGEGAVGNFELNRLSKTMDRTYSGSNHPSYAAFTYAAGAAERIYQIPDDELLSNALINDEDQNP